MRLHCLDVGDAHVAHPLGVRAEGAQARDRVAEVVVDVDDRGECPVGPDGGALGTADMSESCGHLDIARRRHRGRRAEAHALGHDAVAALLEVRGDQRRNAEELPEHPRPLDGCLRLCRDIHDTAGLADLERLDERGAVERHQHVAEELPDLLVFVECCQGLFDPCDPLVVEVERRAPHGVQDGSDIVFDHGFLHCENRSSRCWEDVPKTIARQVFGVGASASDKLFPSGSTIVTCRTPLS